MGRGKPAPALLITDRQHRLLEQESRKRTTPWQYHDRILIVLYGKEGKSNIWVARCLSIALNTVKFWRRRWAAQYSALLDFEKGKDGQGVSDTELLSTMLAVLSDFPRSGAPARITLAQKQQIIAVACEKPDTYGVQMTDWSHEMLAKVVVAKGIVEKISRRHVGGILKKERVASP